MEYFTDLIERSYIYYTKDKNAEIAQFYFEAQNKSKYIKLDFYSELISTIDSLIDKINLKAINLKNVLSILSEEDLENYYNSISEYEIHRDNQLIEHQRFLDDSGIEFTLKPFNPEEQKPTRKKSILKYLKGEAKRAKRAKNIKELNEALDNSLIESEILKPASDDIKTKVRDAFSFTLREDPNKHKIILSEKDFNNLVKWVTYYFENNHKLPKIEYPITKVNTGKGNIRYTFKILFDKIHPGAKNRGNLSALASKCFHFLSEDKKNAISKTSEPNYYDELINLK